MTEKQYKAVNIDTILINKLEIICAIKNLTIKGIIEEQIKEYIAVNFAGFSDEKIKEFERMIEIKE